MGQKFSIYLFNDENPRGLMMNLTEEQIEQHKEDGWLDSPESLKLPEKETGVTMEQANDASPDVLVGLVKSYGFIVLTPEQLKAEANKMAAVALDITKFDESALIEELKSRIGADGFVALNLEDVSDESLIGEAERRGLKESGLKADELNALLDRFNEDPEGMNKDELVAFGNNGYKLGLRSNMKEDTLIAKIKEAIAAE